MWEKLSQPGGIKLEGKGRDSPPIIPQRMIKEIAWEDKANGVPNLCVLKNGTRITFRSCQSGRAKFQGTEFDLVWIDEELEDYGVYEEIRRSMIDRGGKLIWTATPLARARPLLALHEAAGGLDSDNLTVQEFVITMLDNPHVNEKAKQEFIAELLREHPEYYETRVMGEFLIQEGLVYSMYKSFTHEMPRPVFDAMPGKHVHPRVIILDPGVSDPFAILWAMLLPGPRRQMIFYDEYYKRRTTIKQAVEIIKHKTAGDPLLCGIIDPSATKHDPKGGTSVLDELHIELRKQGITSASTGGVLPIHRGDNTIDAGIYKVQEFLAPVPGHSPGIQIVSDLEHFKREMHRYMYALEKPNKNASKKPVDKDNHLMDCMRYLVMGLPPYQAVVSQASTVYDQFKKWQERYNKANGTIKDSIVMGG